MRPAVFTIRRIAVAAAAVAGLAVAGPAQAMITTYPRGDCTKQPTRRTAPDQRFLRLTVRQVRS